MTQEEINALIRSPHNQYYAYYNYAYTQNCGEDKTKYMTDILFDAGQNALMGFMMGFAREVKSQEGKLQNAGSNFGRYLQSKINGYSFFFTDPVDREQDNRREWNHLIDFTSTYRIQSLPGNEFRSKARRRCSRGRFRVSNPLSGSRWTRWNG